MYNKGYYLEIAKVTLHTNYSREKLTHDIALVELDGKFKWSNTVLPACLTTSEYIVQYKGQLMVSFRPSVVAT